MMKRFLCFVFVATVLAAPAFALSIEAGENAAREMTLTSRFRNFQDAWGQDRDGWEMAIGAASGFPAGAANVDFGYGPSWGMVNYFEILYDGTNVNVFMDVDPTLGDGWERQLTYSGYDPAALNYIQFSVVNRDVAGEMWLTNLTLDGTSLGNFGTTNPGVSDGWQTWNITGDDWSDGFVLSGYMNLSGPFANATTEELSKLDFGFGSLPPVPEPATVVLLGLGLGAVAMRYRKRRA